MKINIANIDDGLSQLELREPSRELTLLDHGHLTGDILVKMAIDKRPDVYLLRFSQLQSFP